MTGTLTVTLPAPSVVPIWLAPPTDSVTALSASGEPPEASVTDTDGLSPNAAVDGTVPINAMLVATGAAALTE